jgi:hypothetical protein
MAPDFEYDSQGSLPRFFVISKKLFFCRLFDSLVTLLISDVAANTPLCTAIHFKPKIINKRENPVIIMIILYRDTSYK